MKSGTYSSSEKVPFSKNERKNGPLKRGTNNKIRQNGTFGLKKGTFFDSRR